MPTYIQEAETAWNVGTTPKTTAAFDVLAGDVIVGCAMLAQAGDAYTLSISNSGSALTWTQRAYMPGLGVIDKCRIGVWTAVVDTDRTGMTVTFSRTSGGDPLYPFFGGNALTFRDTTDIGWADGTNIPGTGLPTKTISTMYDNSIVVVAIADIDSNNGASRAWLTGAGTFIELSYYYNAVGPYTLYLGYHVDTGAMGSKIVGMSWPDFQSAIIATVELGAVIPPTPEQTEIITLTSAS